MHPHLTPLSNGQPGIRSSLTIETRSPGPAELAGSPDRRVHAAASVAEGTHADVLDFIASDESLDRYGEVISASGWLLDTYRRNPVFQNAHQYGDIVFTLGRALITEVRPGISSTPLSATPTAHSAPLTAHLFQRVQFATDINPMARIAYGLYRAKFLNAVSVGFIP